MVKKHFFALIALSVTIGAMDRKTSSLREKIAQMMVIATTADNTLNAQFVASQPYNLAPEYAQEMVQTENVGGIIFIGLNTREDIVDLHNKFQSSSEQPLFFFLDSEWGLSMRIPERVVTYPKAMTLGALSEENDHLIQELGQEIGRQLQSIGIHSPLAPVCDVNNNPANPIINRRSFGENPDKVARKATLFMRGIEQAGLLACAKHFPGHGDTNKDTHHSFATVPHDMDRLTRVELEPFRVITKNGISAVMNAHLDVPALTQEPGLPATFSKKAHDYLRNTLGFKGLIVTDGMGMVGAQVENAVVKAVKAGTDIILCPVDVKGAIDAIEQAVNAGEISEQEIDAHVERITAAKERVCTTQAVVLHPQKLRDYQAINLKEKLYKEAVTLARNSSKRLPLKKDQVVTLITIGTDDDNPFYQELSKYLYISSQSLPANASSDACNNIFSDVSGENIIVAIHYASRSGMIEMSSKNEQKTMPDYIDTVNSLGDRATLVLFGNPYNLAHLSQSGATIVAYEDEPEAQIAAAQTIIGLHNPTGKLPVTASAQYPLGTGYSYDTTSDS